MSEGACKAEALLAAIHDTCRHPWTLMEVCGGQTHALLRHGIDRLLPEQLQLIHGPGCPVCVTASEHLDHAIALAQQPNVILCSYGDMLRVPGSTGQTLLEARARGANVRVVYSPLDVLASASANPNQRVVFLAVGFETTAPATALLALQAQAAGVTNLELLVCHVRVPPVLDQMLSEPACQVQAVLAAGVVGRDIAPSEFSPGKPFTSCLQHGRILRADGGGQEATGPIQPVWLALAVSGRIVATTRTSTDAEWRGVFAAFVPEDEIPAKAELVELYEIPGPTDVRELRRVEYRSVPVDDLQFVFSGVLSRG